MKSGYKEKIPDDIALAFAPNFTNDELGNAARQLTHICTKRPKSIVVEVNIFRKYVPILIAGYIKQSEGFRKACMQINRCTEIEYDRSNKHWTKEEDETLIELVCEGKDNIHQLSTIFGRSPGAIKTHISDLVGRRRLTQEVAGRFIGTINGETSEAVICGTVHKE